MNRDKQIEEMAKEFCPLFETYGTCETCDAILDMGDNPCVHKSIASIVIAHGYRKASEVAEEIFAEIEEARERWETVYSADHFGYGGSAYGYLEIDVDHTIYELKNKYAEDTE